MKIGKVCASVSAETSVAAIRKLREAEEVADLIEIRFDHLHGEELPALLNYLSTNGSSKPLIATFRASDQGGHGPLSADRRIKFWNRLGGDFWAIDLEEDVFDSQGERTRRILSFHDFDSPGTNAEDVFERLRSQRPEIIKYAYMAEDATDTLPIWKTLELANNSRQPLIAIAMGEAGKITRVLGPAYGSQWSYGSVDTETAPGQISAGELRSMYHIADLNRETRVYGVIGDPVSTSRSPRIHNAAFRNTGLNSVFVPLLVKDLGQFMKRMVRPATREVDLNFGGFAVTMPHKISIMAHLDEIDETAIGIGAVNTVAIKGGKMYGHNTDADGFMGPLLSRIQSPKGARAAIFGAGGAARACLYAMKEKGIAVTVFSRDPLKAGKLAAEFGADSIEMGRADLRSFDIVINATPVGMDGYSDQTFFSLPGIEQTKLVYDLVTTVEPTALIRSARAAGVETITGVEMLIAQAVRQFELWTGNRAPVDIMEKAATSG